MREIKFRAWDTYCKRWRDEFDWGIEPDTGKPHWIHEGELWQSEATQLIVSQSTGLKDKNGKEIYEGDIVQWCGKNCQVWWQVFAGYWAVDMGGTYPAHLDPNRPLMQYSREMEIIGNIYENPDLLTQS